MSPDYRGLGPEGSRRPRSRALTTDRDEDQIDLRRAWSAIWSRAWLVVGLPVIAFLVVFAYSSTRTDLYQATAKVRVVDPNSEAVFDGVQIRTDPKRDVDTQLALMRSDDLRAEVDQSLGETARLISGVSMAGVGSTDLISVTVKSSSPDAAAAAANAFASIYVEQRKEQATSSFAARADELRQKSAELQSQIDDIDRQLDGDPPPADSASLLARRSGLVTQQSTLDARATQLDVEAATRSGNVELAETAVVPTKPVYPKPIRDGVVAAALAFFLAVGVALLLDRLDDRVHDPAAVEALGGGLPVIGVIPIHSPSHRPTRRLSRSAPRELVPLESTTAEAFRALRSNLRFSAVGSKRTTILLTSSEGSEGKSTVAANLAVVLAESGLRVVLVSADLRRPTLAGFFGVEETKQGLTSVLLGDTTLSESLVPVRLDSGRSLYVLPAGPLPQNPAEVLGSAAMSELLGTIERAGADFILVDSAPVLPVADALALSQFADGVLVLAMAGRTPRSHLAETLDRLRQVNAAVLGVVLDAVPTKGRYSKSYGGYSYGYRDAGARPHIVPTAPSAGAHPGSSDEGIHLDPVSNEG